MKQTAVLYPCPGQVGHIFPMMELANVFAKHAYNVTVVLFEPPPPFDSAATQVRGIIAAATNPSISFHVLPPFPGAATINSCEPGELMVQVMRHCNDKLERFIRSIIPRQRLHSLVIDFLNGDAIDVAAKLSVPVYTFLITGATALAVFAQLPALCRNRQTGLMELGSTLLTFLGAPSMPASHLATEALAHPEDDGHKFLMHITKRLMDTGGIMVNSLEPLERRAVEALTDHLCVPAGRLPPVYCVGPLVAKTRSRNESEGAAGRHECLAWLDGQPERTVVFLCFGSMGVLSEEQLREMAIGLEKSGQRFLWVVRRPASGWNDLIKPREFDLEEILPKGFIARTNGRGLVVESWAPQADVLQHPSTGAFVTHCGWNSTLEAVMAGVPMLCWPLYAEQKMNKVFMTSSPDQGGMAIGVEMDGYQVGFVKAEEVAAKLRMVMESDQGKEFRARVAANKKDAEAALDDGGLSDIAFRRFLLDVQTNHGSEQ